MHQNYLMAKVGSAVAVVVSHEDHEGRTGSLFPATATPPNETNYQQIEL